MNTSSMKDMMLLCMMGSMDVVIYSRYVQFDFEAAIVQSTAVKSYIFKLLQVLQNHDFSQSNSQSITLNTLNSSG